MSENETTVAPFVSSTSDHTNIAQTPENTTPPFEHVQDAQPMDIPPPAVSSPPKKKRVRMTRRQRAARIAGGWNPPGPRPRTEAEKVIESVPRVTKPKGPSDAEVVLKSLVMKLVAIENDVQYRAVWTHYFMHGGVYLGPKYVDELNDAIQYLMRVENAETSVGKQS